MTVYWKSKSQSRSRSSLSSPNSPLPLAWRLGDLVSSMPPSRKLSGYTVAFA